MTYAFIYLGAVLIALAATPVMVHVARILNIVDKPGVRKIHAFAIPRIGGAAIVLAMMGIVIPLLMLDHKLGHGFAGNEKNVTVLLAAGLFMFVLGLIDDITDMRARVKLAGQVLAAMVVCAFGIRIDSIDISDSYVLQFGWLSWPLTIFWIVGITNAVNLIDGLDGLAAGIAAVACAVMATFALYTGQPTMAIIMIALLGGLTGFLFFNFNPARIFMGDCGTMFIGFVLATSGVLCAAKSATLVGLALPALALGIPIFDTLFSIIRRLLERRSIFSPDRNHIHHRLLRMGIQHRHAVILMYLMTLISAGLGMFLMFTRNTGTIIVLGCIIVLLIGLFRVVGAVHFAESIAAIQRNMTISRQAKEDKRVFEYSVLRIRETNDFQSWWQAICATAEKLEFAWLEMYVTDREGQTHLLVWRCTRSEGAMGNDIRMILPVCSRKFGTAIRMEFAVSVRDSLEAAGRRIAYFSRLIEECRLLEIPKNLAERERNYTFINRRIALKKSSSTLCDRESISLQEPTMV